ncbi:MAG: hypothetical protein HY303_04425, partial [Candidatus Wallbacteria bacterium]|nr:hypothetical protein [Candidatus Wallbacteria bacterium]
MIVFPLSLKPTGRPIREAAAWFISGEKPAAWLEELSQWGVELAGVALLALPVAPGRKTPCGVLAVPPAGSKPAVTPRAQPYGALAGRLYLPANSRLDPEVSEDELRVVIPWHALVLHPALGPVGFRREQTLGVADLIEAPPARGRRWNSARQAESAELRLLSVESEAPASLDAVLQEAKDDIGTRKTEELPRQSDRPTDGNAGLLGKWARRQVAQTVNWLAGKVPGGAGANTWVNDVQDWARKRLDDWGSSLELARHRELLRLLRMLDTDPDEGLKYALPLKGFGARGVAEPGMKLGPREPSFSLDRVGGGRPADVWSTPWQIRAKLSEAYRKQAEREVALKRFRRAAYIYAELLGDFESAAAVLKQGRHFREAAVLYRDHLRRPIAAAHCLEEGGLLLE